MLVLLGCFKVTQSQAEIQLMVSSKPLKILVLEGAGKVKIQLHFFHSKHSSTIKGPGHNDHSS